MAHGVPSVMMAGHSPRLMWFVDSLDIQEQKALPPDQQLPTCLALLMENNLSYMEMLAVMATKPHCSAVLVSILLLKRCVLLTTQKMLE